MFINGVCLFLLAFPLLYDTVSSEEIKSKEDLLLITVATNETDGFQRFIRSTKVFGIPVKVVGMGEKWQGGIMSYPGGGHKIMLFMKALEPYKDDKEKIILFTDSYDVVIAGTLADLIHRFKQMDAGIVISAESSLWPDRSLADKYPVTESKYKYLNSGGLIGYASDIYNFISSSKESLTNSIDDQYFYTKLFLDFPTREKFRVKLDYKANIFQNLYGAEEDIELRFDDVHSYLENTKYSTVPLIIHGNGLSKVAFNTVANYIANSWTMAEGCVTCNENRIIFSEDENGYPKVLVGVFISTPTPFLEEFFEKLYALNYPKKKMHFFIYNSVEDHMSDVDKFTDSHSKEYGSIKQIRPSDELTEIEARSLAIHQWEKKKCDYLLSVDSIAHIDNPKMLRLLIEANRKVIAPLLLRPYKAWSNFWGAVNKDGFYQRSFDYLDIVNYNRQGIWNVPYITNVYLLNATLLGSIKPNYKHETLDPDMAFCNHLREKEIFMFVDNTVEYGHLIDPENMNTSRKHPDIYQLINNRYDWEQRYLHPDYSESLNPNKTVKQPCPDVYWFPVTTPRFCKEWIDIMENFGKWSDGSNYDDRLDGGYENVPTRDIHMKQVGLDKIWLEILRIYVRPIQERVFIGYHHDPPHSLMNFVVRYMPNEQSQLRPHHDSSTYTVNLALNRPNIDYKGGGCRFLRYNCSVTDTKVGWMLMHPGRLTHYHEGLQVTNGTRYIMISFVDP